MKSRTALIPFAANLDALCCPLCKGGLAVRGGSLVCGKGHCYDVSSKGYLNFGPPQETGQYDKGLFESRRSILQSGLFSPIVDCACEMAAGALAGRKPTLVDAGCGEGTLSLEIHRRLCAQGGRTIALDIERSAIRLACKLDREICWLVADNHRLPVADGKADILLNILTPANYAEFQRVLSAEGLLIKVVPGAEHLREVRGSISEQLRRQEYSNEAVLALFDRNVARAEAREILCRRSVPPALGDALFRMTPMTHRKELAGTEHLGLDEVTIHLWVLSGRPKKKGEEPGA